MNPFFCLRITVGGIAYVAIAGHGLYVELFSLDPSGRFTPILPGDNWEAVKERFLEAVQSPLPDRVEFGVRFHRDFFFVRHEGVRYGLLVPYMAPQGAWCYRLDEQGCPCGDRVVGGLFQELCITSLMARELILFVPPEPIL